MFTIAYNIVVKQMYLLFLCILVYFANNWNVYLSTCLNLSFLRNFYSRDAGGKNAYRYI